MNALDHGLYRTGVRCAAVAFVAGALGASTITPASATPLAPTPKPVVTTTPAPTAAFRTDARLASPGGLVAGITNPGTWWSFDSRPGRARLYAVGADGRVVATYTVTGARRWDAIVIAKGSDGKGTLMLADLAAARTGQGAFSLYRIPEPTRLVSSRLAAQPYQARFPDGAHEAGTLLANHSEGRLYVITKAVSSAAVYALPSVLGPEVNDLTRVRRLPFGVRGGAFTQDDRVVLRTPDAVRVLGGIRDRLTHVIRVSASAGGVFGISSDGRRALLAGTGARPVFRAVPLPAAPKSATPEPGSTVALTDRTDPVSYPSGSGLPGGLIGTGAMAGLVLLAALGGGFYLWGRRRDG